MDLSIKSNFLAINVQRLLAWVKYSPGRNTLKRSEADCGIFFFPSAREMFIWSASLKGLGFCCCGPFCWTGTRVTFNKKTKNIWNKWQRSVQQCGLRPLKLGSHVTLLTRSHGEADVNKMEISVVQQPAVVTHWNCKYQTWSSGGVTLGLETPHFTRWSVSDGMFFDRALHWCI